MSKRIILEHVNIYTGEIEGELLKDYSLSIVGRRIEKIEKTIKSNKKDKVINLDGKYITPGLINLHVHLPGSGNFKSNGSAKKIVNLIENHASLHFIGRLLGKSSAKKQLYSGVTTLRAVGGVSHFDTEVRKYILNHPTKGSRIFCSDYAIATADGHMVGTVSRPISTPEEGIKMVDELAAHNVDLIKVMITGGVLDGTEKGVCGVIKMNENLIRPIVDRAHELGLKVATHVESKEGVKLALQCKIDSIEHGSDLDDEMIQMFKDNNSTLTITMSPAIPLAFLKLGEVNESEVVVYNAKFMLNEFILGAKKALKAGITVGLGNDTGCPFVPHYIFWREMEYLHKLCDIPRQEVLHIATKENAKILGKDNEFGSIKESLLADLVILNSDPLEGFSAYENIEYVVKEGLFIKKPKIKQSEIIDDAHNEILKRDLLKEL